MDDNNNLHNTKHKDSSVDMQSNETHNRNIGIPSSDPTVSMPLTSDPTVAVDSASLEIETKVTQVADADSLNTMTAVDNQLPETLDLPKTILPCIGDVIDNKYKILETIGRGGMGAVYKVEHLLLEKQFALKILHPHLSQDENFRKRFLREAKLAMEFAHEHALQIREFGISADGFQYFTMDFSGGKSLKEILEHEPVSLQRALTITRQVLSALQLAHSKNIVHRDLKPANILVENRQQQDHALVLDFGIAKALQESNEPQLTQQAVLGTPHYMSPEQASAQDLQISSDIYSVGVILYEMATGILPFPGSNTMEVIVARVLKDPVPPRQINPEISPALEKIILKAMAKEPCDRYTASEFIYDIDHIDQLQKTATSNTGKSFKWIALVFLVVLFVAFKGPIIKFAKNYKNKHASQENIVSHPDEDSENTVADNTNHNNTDDTEISNVDSVDKPINISNADNKNNADNSGSDDPEKSVENSGSNNNNSDNDKKTTDDAEKTHQKKPIPHKSYAILLPEKSLAVKANGSGTIFYLEKFGKDVEINSVIAKILQKRDSEEPQIPKEKYQQLKNRIEKLEYIQEKIRERDGTKLLRRGPVSREIQKLRRKFSFEYKMLATDANIQKILAKLKGIKEKIDRQHAEKKPNTISVLAPQKGVIERWEVGRDDVVKTGQNIGYIKDLASLVATFEIPKAVDILEKDRVSLLYGESPLSGIVKGIKRRGNRYIVTVVIDNSLYKLQVGSKVAWSYTSK